jgi:hypothetical protein
MAYGLDLARLAKKAKMKFPRILQPGYRSLRIDIPARIEVVLALR